MASSTSSGWKGRSRAPPTARARPGPRPASRPRRRRRRATGRLERDGPRAAPVQERLAPVQGRRGHELALVRERVARALPRHRDPERRRPALDQLPPGAGRLRRGPRNLKKEAAPQLRVDARRGQPRRRALAVEREVRPHRARHAVRLASSATKAAPPLTSIFSARTSPAGAPRMLVRAAEQLRRRAPLGGRHEPPEQGVLLQALAAVLLGAGVVERLPNSSRRRRRRAAGRPVCCGGPRAARRPSGPSPRGRP